MKKILCISAIVTVITTSVATAAADAYTITGGYARGNMRDTKMNKTNGLNIKYSYEQDKNQLGLIGALTYTEQVRDKKEAYTKGQYYGITGGPIYRFNDYASVYGVVGFSYGKMQQTKNAGFNRTASDSDCGFSCGAGIQFNLIENVVLDCSYEKSFICDVDISTWIVGIGYRF